MLLEPLDHADVSQTKRASALKHETKGRTLMNDRDPGNILR
jgi:hypothetical protein